jgi:hypothetical protein
MAEKKKIEERKIRLIWDNADDTPSYYANHMQVSFGGGTEFHITFGHLSPPLTFGLEEHELPEEIKIKPSVEIVASPDVMRAFVKVLVGNLENYEKSMLEREKEND